MFPVFASRTRFETLPLQKHKKGIIVRGMMLIVSAATVLAVASKEKAVGVNKPRSKMNTDPAVSHIAVCDSVSEQTEVRADSFFASVDMACASLERSTHRTSMKRATRGTNGIKIGDAAAFEATSGSKRMKLDRLSRIPGLPNPELWIGDTGCNYDLTSSTSGMTDLRPVSNRALRSASGSRMKAIVMGNLRSFVFSHGKFTPVRLNDFLVPSCTEKFISFMLGIELIVTIMLVAMELFA